jgi:hypothetical protein
VKTPRERAEEKRQAKLDAIDEQVKNGQLVIRQMTDKEKAENPSKPRPERKKRY